MIIENPERLGLSQLHQLRGRIGRGGNKSYCILLYKPPLSKIEQLRLKIFKKNNNGLIISQKDLEIRGPGKLLGTKQTGNLQFQISKQPINQKIIEKTQFLAKQIYHYYPHIVQLLIKRWVKK